MAWVDQITLFDILVALICLIFLVRGVWVGFVRQLATIAALFLGFYLAGRYHREIYDLVLPFLDSRQFAFVLTYLIILLLIYVGGVLLGLLLKKVMTLTLLTWFDRLLGGVFGLGKGFFVSCLIFMALAAFVSGTNNFLRRSVSFPLLTASSRMILDLVQDPELGEFFLPRKPAIPLDSVPPAAQPGTPPSRDEDLPPVEQLVPVPPAREEPSMPQENKGLML
ncbi:MAG: CvpA family protein [Desulfobacterales bacterium]|nr:CvpA family protein [Desulfobacterales bacterium]